MSIDVGPVFSLSPWPLIAGAAVGAVGVGLVGAAIVSAADPARLKAVPLAVGVAFGAKVIGMLAINPWKRRHLGRWGLVFLAGRGVSFASVLILGVSLYFAARPDPLAFGLVAATAYFAAMLCELAAYARMVKARSSSGHP